MTKATKRIDLRKATQADLNDVLRVAHLAFGEEEGPVIVELVTGLLNDPSAAPVLSLLAFDNNRAVGHILFTRARITAPETAVTAAILAPLAVIPDAQAQGVGGQLVREGLKRLADQEVALVFVLGHPTYYPRHGFRPAGALGLQAPYPIPDKNAAAWMVQELRAGVIGSVTGTVKCADALARPEYWRE